MDVSLLKTNDFLYFNIIIKSEIIHFAIRIVVVIIRMYRAGWSPRSNMRNWLQLDLFAQKVLTAIV